MLQDITAEVKAIAGIESVTTGEVSTTRVSAPVVHTGTPLPSTSKGESESKLSFVIVSVAGGVAMLSIISIGCFWYRRLSSIAGKSSSGGPRDRQRDHAGRVTTTQWH